MGLFSNIFSKDKKSPADKNETFLSAVRRMDDGRDNGDGVFPRIMMSMSPYLNAVGDDMPLVHKLAFLQIVLVVRCGLYLQGASSPNDVRLARSSVIKQVNEVKAGLIDMDVWSDSERQCMEFLRSYNEHLDDECIALVLIIGSAGAKSQKTIERCPVRDIVIYAVSLLVDDANQAGVELTGEDQGGDDAELWGNYEVAFKKALALAVPVP